MSVLLDVWNAIHGIVTAADPITLAIAAVILIAAGYMMEGVNSLVTTTVVALVAFALLGYVRAVTLGKQPAAAYATTDWHNFATSQGLTLLAYALTFAAGILVVHLVSQLIKR